MKIKTILFLSQLSFFVVSFFTYAPAAEVEKRPRDTGGQQRRVRAREEFIYAPADEGEVEKQPRDSGGQQRGVSEANFDLNVEDIFSQPTTNLLPLALGDKDLCRLFEKKLKNQGSNIISFDKVEIQEWIVILNPMDKKVVKKIEKCLKKSNTTAVLKNPGGNNRCQNAALRLGKQKSSLTVNYQLYFIKDSTNKANNSKPVPGDIVALKFQYKNKVK